MSTKPPELFNLDAEASLAGAALLAGREVLALPIVKAVKPADFWSKSHAATWAAILKVAGNGGDPDQVVVVDELQRRGKLEDVGGAAGLLAMVNACESWPRADSYAAVVLDWSRQRRAQRAIFDLGAALGEDGAFSAQALRTWEALGVIVDEASGPIKRLEWKFKTLADAYAPRQPLEFAIDGLLTMPSLSVVYGAPGCLKSFLLADAALCVAGGCPWLPPIPTVNDTAPRATALVPVIWLDFDNGTRRTDERIEALARARDLEPEATPFFYVSMPTPWLDGSNPASIDALSDRLTELNARLVIVDNLGTVSGGADENSADMIQVLANFRRLAEFTGAAVVLIHHQRKSTGFSGRAGETLRGHSSIEAALDLALLVEREEGSSQVTVKSTKTRDVDVLPFGAIFTYEHREGSQELAAARFWGTPVKDTSSDAGVAQAIIEAVEEEPEIQKSALIEAVKETLPDVGVNRIRRRIDGMAAEGELEVTRGGKTGRAKCYTAP